MTPPKSDTVVTSKVSRFFHLFCCGRFSVPWHQRRYDWAREHVEELILDIADAVSSKRACYFLGTVILVESGSKRWEINDGQQRMVTLSLLFAKFRDAFGLQGDARRRHWANRALFDITETDPAQNPDHMTPRLEPPRDDQVYYNALIRGHQIDHKGKLVDAWRCVDRFVSDMTAADMVDYFEYLIDHLEVSHLDIPRAVDPNAVFETVNCRGKPLDHVDLIRNHLYSYFNDETNATQRDEVHRLLEDTRRQLGEQKNYEEYMRCFFQSRYGHLKKTTFYRDARRGIQREIGETQRPDGASVIIRHLAQNDRIELFRNIIKPDLQADLVKTLVRASGQTNNCRNIGVFLRELHSYKVVQPLVFAMMWRVLEAKADGRVREAAAWLHDRLRNLCSLILRTALVRKFEPSKFDQTLSNLAMAVTTTKFGTARTGRQPNVDRVVRTCDDDPKISDDGTFRQIVVDLAKMDTAKAKRLLFGINGGRQRDAAVLNDRAMTLEHILPQGSKHHKTWHGFDQHRPSDWIHRPGNLTLLARKDNKPGDAANRNFAAKKKVFRESAFRITRDLARNKEWSPERIMKRQAQLADEAAEIWSFTSEWHAD